MATVGLKRLVHLSCAKSARGLLAKICDLNSPDQVRLQVKALQSDLNHLELPDPRVVQIYVKQPDKAPTVNSLVDTLYIEGRADELIELENAP